MIIRCTKCSNTNPEHYLFCITCGADLRTQHTPDENSAEKGDPADFTTHPAIPHVPLQTPRAMVTGIGPMLKPHSFGLMFGGIWAGVGGLLFVVFVIIGALAMPLFALFSLLPLLFFVIGAAIMGVALRKANQARDVMLHGARTVATVKASELDHTFRMNRESSTRITYTYRDLKGELHTDSLRTFDDTLIRTHIQDAQVPVLFDPANPAHSALPSHYKVRFEKPATVEDRRPETLAHAGAPAQSDGWPGTLPLVSSLVPAKVGLLGRLLGAHNGVVTLGGLAFEDETLVWNIHNGPSIAVALDKPFAVAISVWPMAHGRAEIALTIRESGAPATAPSIEFKTQIAQDSIAAHLPVQQEEGAYLAPKDFKPVWAALCYYASLHGHALTRDIRLDASDTAVHTQKAPEVVSAAQR